MKTLGKNKFIALVFTICLLIAAGSVGFTVYAATHPSFTTTIEAGSMVDRVSYVLFRDGSTYFAKNGTTGAIDYSGTNVSAIMLSCISSMPNGGTIFLRNDLYTMDSTVPITTSGIYIEGENTAHHAHSAYGEHERSGTVLQLTTNNIPMFKWKSNGVQTYFGGLKNIHLYGDGGSITGGKAVLIDGGASDLVIDNVFFDLFSSHAIEITAVNNRTWNIWIRNSLIESCDYGVLIHNTMAWNGSSPTYDQYDFTTKLITGVTIERTYFWSNQRDIVIDGAEVHNIRISNNEMFRAQKDSIVIGNYSRRIQIINNHLYDFGYTTDWTYDGIRIEENAKVIQIEANTIGDHWEVGQRYQINLADNATEIQVVGNTLQSVSNGTIEIGTTGTDLMIEDNRGYITEWSGTAEASSSDWISFGVTFPAIPQAVLLTVEELDARYIAQVQETNTTHFRLYLFDETAGTAENVDKTIDWYAEYNPVA